MSSILTNTSAMVALQTLKGINKNLADVQNQISTGKMISNAKDNSAVWAISKVMESDVAGFKAISSSLSLGESTVSVGRQASETVTDLLKEMKQQIVASQEENVDRSKIQTEIGTLRDQIESVVGAAQFNGLSLLSNRDTEEGSGSINVLSSLDRSAAGVEASRIDVGKQDLSLNTDTTVGTMDLDVAAGGTAVSEGAAVAFGTIGWTDDTIEAGMSIQIVAGAIEGVDTGTTMSANVEYVAREGDTLASVTEEIVARLNQQVTSDGLDITFTANGTTAGQIDFQNNESENFDNADAFNTADATLTDGSNSDGTVGGGLELLTELDVTSKDGAKAALGTIEHLIQKSIDSAAAFGSSQKRIEIQSEFVSNLTDALTSGIGTLVDANMEEASARLQALQVQQQLGVQSLSIANQAPQTILSLFR